MTMIREGKCPIAREKAVLFGTLGVMSEAVPNHPGAVINPEAHAVTAKDQRLMRLASIPLWPLSRGRDIEPIAGALGPFGIIAESKAESWFWARSQKVNHGENLANSVCFEKWRWPTFADITIPPAARERSDCEAIRVRGRYRDSGPAETSSQASSHGRGRVTTFVC
jgi:hypothetical protein